MTGSGSTSGSPSGSGPRPARSSGSFGRTVLLGLAGAGLATVAAGQTWATATTRVPAVRTVEAAGSDVAPLALPLSLVALAAWGSILVLRRRARRVVAVVGALASAGVVAAVLMGRGDAEAVARRLLGGDADVTADLASWSWVAVAGAGLACAAFLMALRAAGSWPEMGSRYDAPTGAAAGADDHERAADPTERELWDALDEGHDPTV